MKDGVDRLMPLDEAKVTATVFPVGTGTSFTAEHTGELICFANDALGGYWDNRDNITVVVACDGPCKVRGLQRPACCTASRAAAFCMHLTAFALALSHVHTLLAAARALRRQPRMSYA